MIKILFVIPNLAHGGAERVLVNLVNHMDKSKFDVTVQTMFDTGIYKDQLSKDVKYIPGFKYYFPGNTKVYKLFSPKTLFKLYVKDDYDIIVSYLEGPSARLVGGCTSGSKLVSWIHVEQENEKYVTSVFRNMKEAISCYSSFDRIICVSETVKNDFEKLFNIPTKKDVLYNTVETDIILEKSREAIDDVEFSEKEINICSVAKLMKVKGYDRLIPIVGKLKGDGYPVHLYLIGKGEELETLEKIVETHGLQENVTFLGFKTNPYKYVKACDLYVCSSYREGFSTAVTEALIVGTPVVSTNCSGAYELLGNNSEYGIVTENNEEALYDGIKSILSKDKLEHYKKQAELRGKKFNTNETVAAVENMFEELLK